MHSGNYRSSPRRLALVLLAASVLLGSSTFAYAKPDVEVGFSPSMGGKSALNVVVGAIESAQKEVLVAAYSFTSKPIALALVNAKKRGVNVMVVADKKGNTAKYSAVTFLANEGVPVRLNGNYAIMHNKYIVIDGRDVETGSFNYTQAAAKSNAENALILRGVPELAISYANNFNKLWAEADTLRPAY